MLDWFELVARCAGIFRTCYLLKAFLVNSSSSAPLVQQQGRVEATSSDSGRAVNLTQKDFMSQQQQYLDF